MSDHHIPNTNGAARTPRRPAADAQRLTVMIALASVIGRQRASCAELRARERATTACCTAAT